MLRGLVAGEELRARLLATADEGGGELLHLLVAQAGRQPAQLGLEFPDDLAPERLSALEEAFELRRLDALGRQRSVRRTQ